VSHDGNTILSGTGQITGGQNLNDVKRCIREALEELEIDIPDALL
jgi:hypothetical protein